MDPVSTARIAAVVARHRRAIARFVAVIGAGALGILMLLTVLFTVIFGVLAERARDCGSGVVASTAGAKDIPAEYLELYVSAGAKYRIDWPVLAAVGATETAHGTNNTTSSAGAQGPMQFMPGTWAAYGVDGDGDGDKDVWSAPDAIFGAANYLRASGAPDDWRSALFAYNHADWYVEAVLKKAREYGYGRPEVEAARPAAAQSERMMWPTAVKTVNSPFGMRLHPLHHEWRLHAGVDIPAAAGAPVSAALSGRIVFRGWMDGYGNYVCVVHSARLTTCYAHLSRFGRGQVNATVQQGTVIGYVGSTGGVTGAHLHFETREGNSVSAPAVDPAGYLGEAVDAVPHSTGAPSCGAAGADGSVDALAAAADRLDAMDVPYCYGGGHGTSPARPTQGEWCIDAAGNRDYASTDEGLDCSSSISWVLQRAGYEIPTMDTVGLAEWATQGHGADGVTLWIRPRGKAAHVVLQIDKRYFGTTGFFHDEPRNGPGWFESVPSDADLAGFEPFHISAAAKAKLVGDRAEWVIGDSLAEGTAPHMPYAKADFGRGRTSAEALDRLRAHLPIRGPVVFEVGTNDPSAETLRETLVAAGRLGIHLFVPMVNDRDPELAERKNRVLRELDGGFLHVVEWSVPPALFYDSVHLQPEGYRRRAATIADAISGPGGELSTPAGLRR